MSLNQSSTNWTMKATKWTNDNEKGVKTTGLGGLFNKLCQRKKF